MRNSSENAFSTLIIWHLHKTNLFPESATVKRKQKVGPGDDAQLSPGGKIWDVSRSSHSLDSEQSGM
jgi:hypothetical protein